MNTALSTSTPLHTPAEWLMAFLSIVLTDIVLADDNAITLPCAISRRKNGSSASRSARVSR